MAHQRRREIDDDLEKVFDKVKPILHRNPFRLRAIKGLDLPAALKAEIAAIPDPEQRVREVVKFKLNSRCTGEPTYSADS